MEGQIKANAELTIQHLRPLSRIDFGYTAESIDWLEGYIERLRNSGELADAAMREKLTNVFGSFLGECVIRRYGGSWTNRDGVWCVAFDEANAAYPFAKVAKQIDNGVEDSIGSFFRAIPAVFADHVRLQSQRVRHPTMEILVNGPPPSCCT
jgi:hypothetical protein